MALKPDYLQLVIEAFSKRLKHSDAQMRIKAAQCLGKMGDESIIPLLCQALEAENDLAVQFSIMDAIVLIDNLTSETPMSENTQGSKYNIVQPQNVQIIEQGDGIIHNYATPQNLAEAAQEIQQLISQLTQTYPTNTEIEKQTFVACRTS
ncbi:MAG: HEAT repeat domain-containing protein [Microcystis sp. M53603_WE2]|jgi:hypothetical protein|uniref:Genome sequencing data, contig C324 n=1 Tax=Microcystis aeruginosa PCC 9717 TaxID=1160286 RepID=I4FPV7_MICAE|nr:MULTISPECIES: HEAT repeat domain-containing protein [Microcystis]MCE2663850.1 HEAT repeat domain-containing protein [Microcystis sp. 53602_E8]MCZ8361735.1 HEAT repeat domain-containing protein [Microcystis sp. LE19-251.1A]MDJ0529903.1 HEAT repeat domain-containing protein [Microcystis sp. M53600_WE12]MCZ8024738.1 HEAT repeat domain-containing protein [Microcystis sp. LE19-10.1B]MDJ0541320.1 HEAT repeat domain-containing protein [Microcystis sp. M53603_WE2]